MTGERQQHPLGVKIGGRPLSRRRTMCVNEELRTLAALGPTALQPGAGSAPRPSGGAHIRGGTGRDGTRSSEITLISEILRGRDVLTSKRAVAEGGM